MSLRVIDTLLSCDFSHTRKLLARYSRVFVKLPMSGTVDIVPCVDRES